MNPAVAARAEALTACPPQGPPALRVVALVGTAQTEPTYRLLEGTALQKVQVTETSESGSVPELIVRNDLDQRVFLMDGQELVGAKQNRILNTDVLAPPHSETKIPVSCVEQGRWHYRSAAFAPGKAARFATRRNKLDRVHRALREEGKHDADQAEVWAEVDDAIHCVGIRSATGALSDAYAARQRELDDLRATLELPADAVGIAVYSGGRLQGIDLFDRPATLSYFWNSLIDSYGLDHLGRHVEVADPEPDLPADLSAALSQAGGATWETFASPGEGQDLRLHDDRFSGSALVWDQRSVVHLQLFPKPPANEGSDERRGAAPRPRLHRQYMRGNPGDPGGPGDPGNPGS